MSVDAAEAGGPQVDLIVERAEGPFDDEAEEER